MFFTVLILEKTEFFTENHSYTKYIFTIIMVKYIGFDLQCPFTKSYSQYASIKENGKEPIPVPVLHYAALLNILR